MTKVLKGSNTLMKGIFVKFRETLNLKILRI